MTVGDTAQMPIWKLARYVGVYFLIVAVMVLFTWIVVAVFDSRVPTGLASFLPPMIAALVEGQRFAMDHGTAPPKGRIWRAALRMTGVVLVINLFFFGGFLLFQPEWMDMVQSHTLFVLMFGGALLLLVLLVNRFFYGLGIKSYLKSKAAQGHG
jgi:hypothetical protein